jgi:peptide/nickel transport system substrate-binding protein
MNRRKFLQYSAAAGALTAAGPGVKMAAAAKKSNSIVFASPGTPQSLDTEFDASLGTFDAVSSCYDSLLDYDHIPDPEVTGVERENITYDSSVEGGFKMRGKLAESWDISKDMSSVTFKLREGVKSHWDNELTADDVKWSWERKLALGAIGGFFAGVIGLEKPEQIQVESKYAVTFKLDKPAPLIFRLHRNPWNNIYDTTKVKEFATSDDPWAKDWISNNMAGYGPYRMVSLDRGTSFVAKAHKDYWGPKPSIDTFIMQEVQSSAARVQLIQKGTVDIAQFLTPVEVASLQGVEGVSVDSVQSSWMDWINLNNKEAPFDNAQVRRAMNLAFPKTAALGSVYKGFAKPLEGVIPDIYPGYRGLSSGTEQSLAEAKELLKDAGYADGFSTYVVYDAGQEFMEPLLVLYRSALETLNVKLELRKTPTASYFQEVQAKKHPMTMFRDAPWSPDPGYAMNLYFLSTSFINYSNYSNPEVDKLLLAAANEGDAGNRFELLDKAQKIVLDDQPWVMIANPNYSLVRRSNLNGWVYRTHNHTRAQDFAWT